MNFWTQFESLCLARGEKPTPVVKKLGLPAGSVTSWKNGRVPHHGTLLKIADYFGVSVDYLLGNDTPVAAPASPSPTFTPEEQLVALRYRSVNPGTQAIIRKILDIPNGDEELIPVYHAARSKDGTAEDRIIYRTREEIERLENAPESDIDI